MNSENIKAATTKANAYVVSSKKYASTHKLRTGIIFACVLAVVWILYGKMTTTTAQSRYVLTTVKQGTIVATIADSGQIVANQTLQLQPKVSGQLVAVNVVAGQTVSAGQLIAEIDPTDAQKAVRDAEANLESAKLSLAKLQEPADQPTLLSSQSTLAQAQTSLATDYQTGAADIASAFIDLPSIMTGLQNVDFGYDAAGNGSQWNIDYYGTAATTYDARGAQYRNDAYNAYEAARASYDLTFADYKAMPAQPDQATVEKMLKETYNTSQLVSAAVKSTYALIQFYSDQLTQNGKTPKQSATTNLADLNTYTGKVNPHVTSLLNDTNSLANDKASVDQKQAALTKTQNGADPIDVQTSQLSVTEKQNALQDAEDTLAKYYIYAPFDGTIGTVSLNKYDQAGSGSSIATLITSQEIADLTINEVDAAKLKVGDEATLTFDAITDLTLTGHVAQINPVGTVTQGVVSYDVKISLDTQDPRVKPGMTVNATIQTDVHQNVLSVPQSAVKSKNGQSYVLVFDPVVPDAIVSAAGTQGITSVNAPSQVNVETGISDDTNIEITSGLTQGQQIVSKVITTGTSATPTTQTSAGGNRGMGGGGANVGGIRL